MPEKEKGNEEKISVKGRIQLAYWGPRLTVSAFRLGGVGFQTTYTPPVVARIDRDQEIVDIKARVAHHYPKFGSLLKMAAP
jgi:hypothetical protein